MPTSGSTPRRRAPSSGVVYGAVGGTDGSRSHDPSWRSRSGSGRVERRTKTSQCDAWLECPCADPARRQPPVEPRGHLHAQVDPRPRHRGRRVGVRPRPGQQPVRHAVRRQRGDGAEGVVAVAVGPPRDEHHRAGDPLVARGGAVQPDRSAPPVVPVHPLPQPGQHPGLVGLETPLPLPAPVRAPHRGHGRQHAHRGHVVAVVDEVDQPQRAAAVVHVVGPPVVAGVDRADGLQCGRSLAGELEGVEAGVRRAEHADVAVAPVLVGQPRDHLDEVALLGRGVLVGRVAARGAGAAQVEPAHGVRVLVAELLVAGGVGRGEVVLAVGQRLQQAGLRAQRRVGQEQGRGELDPVGDRGRGPRGSSDRSPAQQGEHLGGVQRLAGVAVAAERGRGGEHRVQHRLLGGLHDGGEQRVEGAAAAGPPGPGCRRGPGAARCRTPRKISPLPWWATEPVRASPSPTRRASRAHAAPSTGASVTTRPMQEPAGFAGPRSAGGSSRPTGTPATTSSSRTPKLVSSSTATVWSLDPPGGGADAALEAEAGHAGAGARRPPPRGARSRRGWPAPPRGRRARRPR